MSRSLRILLVAAWALPAAAQTFEVASVKVAAPTSHFAMRGGPGTSDPGQITYSSTSLKLLVAKAYDVEKYQIAGPSWLEVRKYDIAAKLPPGGSPEQFRLMLRNLLAERFSLAIHRETKEFPVYALVVAKDGQKLKVSGTGPETESADAPQVTTVSLAKDGLPVIPAGYQGHLIGMRVPGKTMLRAKGESLGDFAKVLTGMLDRPVIDLTGLTGQYDFGIAWSDEVHPTEPGPDAFAAVQSQLGLKLESRKAALQMVVVDGAQQLPVAN
jgi:uncharacterized protein (TIGR03435 family)